MFNRHSRMTLTIYAYSIHTILYILIIYAYRIHTILAACTYYAYDNCGHNNVLADLRYYY